MTKNPIFVLDAHLEFASKNDRENFMLMIMKSCKDEGTIEWSTMKTKFSEK